MSAKFDPEYSQFHLLTVSGEFDPENSDFLTLLLSGEFDPEHSHFLTLPFAILPTCEWQWWVHPTRPVCVMKPRRKDPNTL